MRKLLLLPLSWFALHALAAEPVAVWNYQPSPPFASEQTQGLSEALVQLLNEHPTNQGRYDFQLSQLPRKRLDARLAANEPGVLLWASPEFFPQRLTARASWTHPLLCDIEDVVSRRADPVDYEGPDSLHGMRVGGILGYRYNNLQGDIDKGLIQREDVHNDLQNLNKLLAKRVDVVLIARSARLFYSLTEIPDAPLHVSPAPLYVFDRHLLMTGSLPAEAKQFMQQLIADLPYSARWQTLLRRYGLHEMSAPCPHY
ncbi:PAAT family amino acid ABC transporter substrate-binding protein [Pseudomonas stutzeri]|uniref:PAAT family amino acid ABC transporter substrate-binding protein n=1 Tax=Stutzerimonas stutzeri TaxID=316 RepID=UPI001909F9FC|nr:PAAT family amino acid ABC transporter substrate-binding protein [Stutzerimonas stutzeri]MBK3866963.1 PAAT family amino acid ABC transporter substrate-binding protein [Stutzerimonas stutzeri]